MTALLYLSDGTTTVDFLAATSGIHLADWKPALPAWKGGGVWAGSPLSDGRRLALRNFDNQTDLFELKVSGASQDSVIEDAQNLRALLESSVSYWSGVGNSPVYLAARGPCETNIRYAVVYAWKTDSESNAYAQPFFSLNPLDEFALAVEHGPWLENPPGTGTCVQASGTQPGTWYAWGANQVLNPGFEIPGGGGADVFASWSETAGDGAIASDGAVFHSGAASAKLTSGATSNTEITQTFAAALGIGAVLTLSFWTRGDGTNAGRYALYDVDNGLYLKGPVTTGVTAATWTLVTATSTLSLATGNVRVELWCPIVNAGFAHFDDVSLRTRGAARTTGREATCLNEVFFANAGGTAQITDAYYYDASGAAFSANLIGSALPYALLPAVPDVGDILYMMCDAGATGGGPFHAAIFDIGTAAADITTWVYEIWNGSAWAAPAWSTWDETGHFALTGVRSIEIGLDTSWLPTVVNGINGYAFRIRITAVGAAPSAPTQRNRDIYAVPWEFAGVDDLQVPGDIPALARSKVTCHSGNGNYGGFTRLLAGLRSASRGANFRAWLNASDVQNPVGIVCASAPGFVTDSMAPSGRSVFWAPGAAGSTTVYWIFDNPSAASGIGLEYRGSYHAFVRFYQSIAGIADLTATLSLRTYTGLEYWESEPVTIKDQVRFWLADFGKIDLPGYEVKPGDAVAYRIYLNLTNGSSAATQLSIYDLFLLPVDEDAADLYSTDKEINNSYYLNADSVSSPRSKLLAEWMDLSYPTYKLGDLQAVSPGPLVLQAGADQKLYFLMAWWDAANECWTAWPTDLASLQEYRAARYLSMRGAR